MERGCGEEFVIFLEQPCCTECCSYWTDSWNPCAPIQRMAWQHLISSDNFPNILLPCFSSTCLEPHTIFLRTVYPYHAPIFPTNYCFWAWLRQLFHPWSPWIWNHKIFSTKMWNMPKQSKHCQHRWNLRFRKETLAKTAFEIGLGRNCFFDRIWLQDSCTLQCHSAALYNTCLIDTNEFNSKFT